MRLGLRRLAGASAAAVAVLAGGWGPVATAVDSGAASWTVTVGSASRVLFPGTEATMPYDVHNATAHQLRFQAATAIVHVKDGAAAGCRAEWFRVSSNTVPTDVDVAPGDSVHGSLVLAFDKASVSQDACQNVALDVVVTAT